MRCKRLDASAVPMFVYTFIYIYKFVRPMSDGIRSYIYIYTHTYVYTYIYICILFNARVRVSASDYNI